MSKTVRGRKFQIPARQIKSWPDVHAPVFPAATVLRRFSCGISKRACVDETAIPLTVLIFQHLDMFACQF
jgi:hypothetical protein